MTEPPITTESPFFESRKKRGLEMVPSWGGGGNLVHWTDHGE